MRGGASVRAATSWLERRALRWLPQRLYWSLMERCWRWRSVRQVQSYQAPINPFKVEWVPPDSILRHSNRTYPPWRDRWALFGSVQDGDWDLPSDQWAHPVAFRDRIDMRGFRARHLEGVPWEETGYGRHLCQWIESGEVVRGCSTAQEMLERLRAYDRMYHEFRTSGYRSQSQLVAMGREHRTFRTALENEIGVDIGRTGELLFVDGSHRLSMAKIAHLEKIAVVFYVRHTEWMEYRDRMFSTGDLPDHPDLREWES